MKILFLSLLFIASLSANAQVGIGTNTPVAKLEVVGSTSDNTVAAGHFKNSSGTDLLFIRNDGNIGIGTSSPFYSLDINGTLRSTGYAAFNGQVAISGNTTINAGSELTIDGIKIGRRGGLDIEILGIGNEALSTSNTGSNTAVGYRSLTTNTSGSLNVALGAYSLYGNTSGMRSVALGRTTLIGNTTGSDNVAVGEAALRWNVSGSNNVAIGSGAQSSTLNTTGSNNICVGSGTQIQGNYSNSIAIGTNTIIAASNTVRIGNSSNNTYQIYGSWANISDASFKHNINDIPVGLDFIKQLRPVEFVYNNANNEEKTLGFIAQEVKEVVNNSNLQNSNLVAPIDKEYLGLKTTELIPVLTKAIQQQQEQIEEMKKEIEKLKKITKRKG